MRRRTYLIGSIAALSSIAGCGSPGAGVNETDGSPGDDLGSPTETALGSPAATETDGMAETPTEPGSPTEVGSPTEAGTATETDGAAATTVMMVTEGEAFYFDPVGLAVEPGDTVEWVLESGDHSSTAYEDRIPEGAEAWDSGVLTEESASFSHTFEETGTYDYYCTPHQTLGMVARLVVGEPGGPAAGSMPPDGDVPESQRIVDEGSVSYGEFGGS